MLMMILDVFFFNFEISIAAFFVFICTLLYKQIYNIKCRSHNNVFGNSTVLKFRIEIIRNYKRNHDIRLQ